MLEKRIIPCPDVRQGQVVNGVQFHHHEIIGYIVPLARRHAEEETDELVFYDITAGADGRLVSKHQIAEVAEVINILFCVASGVLSSASIPGSMPTTGVIRLINIQSLKPGLASPRKTLD